MPKTFDKPTFLAKKWVNVVLDLQCILEQENFISFNSPNIATFLIFFNLWSKIENQPKSNHKNILIVSYL